MIIQIILLRCRNFFIANFLYAISECRYFDFVGGHRLILNVRFHCLLLSPDCQRQARLRRGFRRHLHVCKLGWDNIFVGDFVCALQTLNCGGHQLIPFYLDLPRNILLARRRLERLRVHHHLALDERAGHGLIFTVRFSWNFYERCAGGK